MAIRSAKTLNTGVVGDYWKVIQSNYNWLSGTLHIAAALYLDEASRKAGCNPIDVQTWDVEIPEVKFSGLTEPTQIIALAYDIIKEQPEFEGATDLLIKGQVPVVFEKLQIVEEVPIKLEGVELKNV